MPKTNMMKNFTIEELCHSNTAREHGLANNPDKETEKNLTTLIVEILDPVREIIGIPIKINSGYRSPELNTIVGGAVNSQHIKGEAADITCSNNKLLFNTIRQNFIFDQLINESNLTWIHVSFRLGNNRRQVFNMNNGK